MFLNILRISGSNVLKTFFNIIVSNGCVAAIFHSYKPNASTNTLYYLATTQAGKKKNIIINKKA